MKCEWCNLRRAVVAVKWQNVWLNVCRQCKANPFGGKQE